MKFKYKMILAVILLLLTFSIYICFNYNSVMSKIQNLIGDDSTLVALEDVSINFLNGEMISYKNNTIEKQFSIINVSDNDVYFNISLTDVINDSNKNINIKLESTDAGLLVEGLTFPRDGIELAKMIKIGVGQTLRFTLTIWGDNLDKDETVEGKLFVNVNTEGVDANPFANLILKNNVINNDASSGLFKGVEDGNDTYYFKGNVDNNYVSFANYSWRIVRITGTNNVRLILDEDLADLIKPYNDIDKASNPSNGVVFNNATAFNTLKDWYSANLNSYDEIINEVNYNSDITYGDTKSGIINFTAVQRLFKDGEPYLNRSGVVAVSKIGLISGDELVLAGISDKADESNYLCNSNIVNNTITYTPYSFNENNGNANMVVMSSNGKLSYQSIKDKGSLRPVIEINANVKVTGGEGTKDNPYIIN